ncbi:MAG TPA: cell division protein ZapA [Bryobacteraceae bacterium]|nr:cell division protein ZapA [Bryobacteraceae bacterium]
MDPAADRKTVRVTLFNQTYTLAAAGTAAQGMDEVESLARSVDDLMHNIAQRSGVSDPARVAVLTALHLADRLRGLEDELIALKERVDHKSREFALLLDKAIE